MKRMTTSTTISTTTERLALALGSNLGDREASLERAIVGLERILGPVRRASLYENAALRLPGTGDAGLPEDAPPSFLNTVVIADRPAVAEPRKLLRLTQALERAAGRQPAARWAPRVLDIDILALGSRIVRDDDLLLPHPGLRSRRFVLVPLAEIAPELPIPPDGATAASLCAAIAPASHPLERRDWRAVSR